MSDLKARLDVALDGAYRLERELGSGGMATVFLARDLKHRRDVALKVMHPELAGDVGAERFLREIRVTAQLQHPHILPVFDSGHADALLWYTMPYVDGETLRDQMSREGRFSVALTMQVARQLASALAYAHAHGVVHRDVKPENVLVTPQRDVLIADFGLALALEPDVPALTATGFGMGTPGYMAPEQLLGERPSRAPVDVYALGVMLHEMLSGARPFADAAPVAELARRMTEGAPSLAPMRPDLPASLASLIQQSLDVDPTRRPTDAGVFLTQLERVVTLPAPPSATAARPRPNAKRAMIGVSAMLVVAAGIWSVRRQADAPAVAEPMTVAVLPFTTDRGDSSEMYLGDGLAEDLTNRLARVRGLRLAPHTSTLRFRTSGTTPEAAAAALGVTHVVLGRLVWNGDVARLSVEMMDATTRARVWGDVLSVPRRDLANAVVGLSHAIGSALAPDAPRVATADLVTRDSQAYNYHLLGQHYFKTFSPVGLTRAVAYQDSAIARDPGFVAAWNGRANALIAMASANGDLTGRDALGPLREALDTVLKMDPGSGVAHASRGHSYVWFEWDWKAATREMQQALALSPGEPLVLLRASFLEMVQAHTDSALRLLDAAHRLDPTNTRIVAATATALFFARRYEESLAAARSGTQLDPTFPPARQFEYLALSGLGRHAEAIRLARQQYALTRQPLMLSTLAIALARGDSLDAARSAVRELVRLSSQQRFDAGLILRPYAVLGDRRQVLAWLERAIVERSFTVSFLQVDPLLDAMRTDPAFVAALERAGVPRLRAVAQR